MLDGKLLERFDIQEISEKTLPPDFERNKKIHRCWEIRKKTEDIHRDMP